MVWLGVLLWRGGTVPRWSAVALPLGTFANIAGFASAGRPILVASYVVLAIGFVPVARAVLAAPARSTARATEVAALA
jgi:hypothetical protein